MYFFLISLNVVCVSFKKTTDVLTKLSTKKGTSLFNFFHLPLLHIFCRKQTNTSRHSMFFKIISKLTGDTSQLFWGQGVIYVQLSLTILGVASYDSMSYCLKVGRSSITRVKADEGAPRICGSFWETDIC